LESCKILFKNKNFIKIFFSFTCVLGFFNQYGTIINEILTRYDYNEKETSLISGVANFVAIFGVYLISIFIDKYKKYKLSFIILNIFGILSHTYFTLQLEYMEKNPILLLIIWSLTSSSILPIYTCSMDFVCEITYPVGETISGGIIMVATQISGIISVKNLIVF
jgi:FLVCR family feline leukemia virus subgroup C receptor-related protein